ncbi:hypothetical protein STENM327S_08027 [Streptomyces tendae]
MGAKTTDAGAGVRRHPGGVNVLNTSGTVTAFFRGQHPLGQDSLNFCPAKDKAGSGQPGPGTGGRSGPRPDLRRVRGQLLNAASNDALGGSKSKALSRLRASGAPCTLSMPASSHSTETGPW